MKKIKMLNLSLKRIRRKLKSLFRIKTVDILFKRVVFENEPEMENIENELKKDD